MQSPKRNKTIKMINIPLEICTQRKYFKRQVRKTPKWKILNIPHSLKTSWFAFSHILREKRGNILDTMIQTSSLLQFRNYNQYSSALI